MTHIFDIDHAGKYGVEEAILISHIVFWIQKNKANKKHFYEGATWTYSSASAFTEIFTYWNQRKITKIIDSLVSQNVIKKGNYNQSAYDRTLWYSLVSENEFLKTPKKEDESTTENKEIDLPKKGNGKPENRKPIPDTIQIDNYIKEHSKECIAHLEKKPFGSNQNVMLTTEERLSLSALTDRMDHYLESMSDYIKNYPRKYKDHFAALKNWIRRDKNEIQKKIDFQVAYQAHKEKELSTW